MRQHRRLGRVDEVHAHRAALHAAQEGDEPVHVHGLVQAVEEGLAYQHVIGDDHRTARRVLLARRQGREDRRHEVVGLHALDGQGVLLPAPEPQHRQGAVEVPAPAGREHGRGQHRLAQHGFGGLGPKQPGGAVEREAVLGPERQHDGVVIGRRLQLEVERGAEALAQRQAQPPVDAPAQWGVHDHLHATGLVEEPFEHEVVTGRKRGELAQTGRQVLHQLLCRVRFEPARLLDVGPRRVEDRGAPSSLPESVRSSPTARRSSETSSDSSSVRLGASPTQNGMVGCAPPASTTRTSPWVTRRMRHECVPSKKTSPTIDSMAKSSLTVPTGVSSGSATTR